ncbi:MAG: methionine ABC transporter substrate-binding protein [Clostridiales bacterium GWB2_37_7]|nr:MAG: methionine ABC transporter substrate-binding protein [Clostridiales bacterium GWB2_37_7]
MKKIITLMIVISIMIIGAVGCTAKPAEQITGSVPAEAPKATVIKVGATPIPHAELLNFVKPLLEKENIKLEIVEFQDYVQPNTALVDKELDANFFQHQPYLDSFNKERSQNLLSAGSVHVEPLGLYSKSIKNVNELKEDAVIAIPNDPSNASRALLLLQSNGLLKLKDGGSITSTENDIVENPKNLKIELAEAAQLPRVLEDVDAAVINTNYALPANLNPVKDALLIEGKDSPYANNIVVRSGDQEREEIKKLVEVLNSPEVKKFIEDKYQGAVVPAF